MCDPGEKVSQTLLREFLEEALDSLGKNNSNKEEIENYLKSFFESGIEVCKNHLTTTTLFYSHPKICILFSILFRFIEATLMIQEIPVFLIVFLLLLLLRLRLIP